MLVTSLWLAHGILYVHEALLLVGFCNAYWRVFGIPVTHLQLQCRLLYDTYICQPQLVQEVSL
jgi:hypothetical protein